MDTTRSVGSSAVVPIAATGLAKTYRDRPAVDGIDLTVLPGERYGFLGPNGAGKTTTVRMLPGRARRALAAIDLTVRPGEIYGFLGPNGAGKTTTMRMLLGLVRPDAGSVRLFGRAPLRDEPAARSGPA